MTPSCSRTQSTGARTSSLRPKSSRCHSRVGGSSVSTFSSEERAMTRILRSVCAVTATGATIAGMTACGLDVANPSVIDASTFNPNADGQTLSLSAQTNLFIAYQSVAQYGGLVADELWSGAARLPTDRPSARPFAFAARRQQGLLPLP